RRLGSEATSPLQNSWRLPSTLQGRALIHNSPADPTPDPAPYGPLSREILKPLPAPGGERPIQANEQPWGRGPHKGGEGLPPAKGRRGRGLGVWTSRCNSVLTSFMLPP
ncbi:hypothetical protein H1C71_021168, partial [Ictidomys tridecemlineatus]